MVSRQITIVNRDGFHMRAAGDFAKAMATFDSEVTVSSAAKRVNGKSMMHLIASGFQKGTELTIQCEGPDEAAQLEAACEQARQEAECAGCEMIASGFGEA